MADTIGPALCAVEMELACSEAIDPYASGRATHAAFLSLLRAIDARMAERLHEREGAKPFSVAILGAHQLATRHPPALRVTSLDTGLTDLLVDDRVWRGRPIKIRNTEARIATVTTSQNGATGSQPCSHTALLQQGREQAGGSDRLSVGLRFLTPTTFRLVETSLMMPLPWPRLVFQSLEQKWNAFSPEGIWINWLEFDRRVSIARHAVRTEMVDMGSYRQVGFVGDVQFILHRGAPLNVVEATHALALFARYGGVGAKTTMGMGAAVPLSLPEPWLPAPAANARTASRRRKGEV